MTPLPPLNVEVRSLLKHAQIKVLLAIEWPNGLPRAGAQTSVRAGVRTLSAFHVAYGDPQDYEDGSRLEVVTLPRDRVLGSRHDPGATDEAAIEAFLEREARREIAMRSLELGDGAAAQLDRPLGEVILAREEELPAASPGTILVNGETTSARTISFGCHAATWSSLCSHRVAALVYARSCVGAREFVALDLSE